MRQNNSGLRPLGRAVLVEMYEPERKKGIIEVPDLVKDRTDMVEQRAIVVEVGSRAWEDEGPALLRLFGIRSLRAKPGDKVLVTRFAGYMTKGTYDGRRYRLVNDRDLF